jgi:hypothetical protein
MGPFLGPFAAAFLAALIAGVALGMIRLSRHSLEWWRRVRSPAGALAPADAPLPSAEFPGPAPAFPGVQGAIGCAVAAAILITIAALVRSFGLRGPAVPPALPPIAPHPFDPKALLPRALGLAAFAALALAGTLALALFTALLDAGITRALGWISARIGRGRSKGAEDALTFADLRAGASGLWGAARERQESFGVGVAFVALFVTPVAAIALLACSAFGVPAVAGVHGPLPMPREALLLFGALFLAVPAAYAAAAERSQRDEGADLRRRAALRQLVAAPLWALALLVLGLPGEGGPPDLVAALAWILLAAAVLIALPGTTGRPLLAPPRGGDHAEPSAALRAMTGLAHHAWLFAWTGYAALALAPGPSPIAFALTALGLLVALLVARALALGKWTAP